MPKRVPHAAGLLLETNRTMTDAHPETHGTPAPATPALPEPETRQRAGLFRIALLCCLSVGINFTEAASTILLPLTLRRYTTDIGLIGWILAVNPAFGFIAQPLVGVLSDRLWTPVGRRAFFIILASPIVALCLVAIPFVSVLWHLVVLNVIYQFFHDVNNGANNPLLADLIPPEQRTFVVGCLSVAGQLQGLFIGWFVMAWISEYKGPYYGAPLYWLAAGALIVMVMLPAFFIGEQPIRHAPRPPLTIRRYARDLFGDPMLRLLALYTFLRAFQMSAILGYGTLFAMETLGLNEKMQGRLGLLGTVITLALAIPIGVVVERFAKPRVMLTGMLLMMAGYLLAWFTTDWSAAIWHQFAAGTLPRAGLVQVLALTVLGTLIGGSGSMLVDVTGRGFLTEFLPVDLIGQLTGALNVFFALGRTSALVVVGYAIKWSGNDYKVIFPIAIAIGCVLLLLLRRMRDPRWEARHGLRRSGETG